MQIQRPLRFLPHFTESCKMKDGQIVLVYEFRGLERPWVYHPLYDQAVQNLHHVDRQQTLLGRIPKEIPSFLHVTQRIVKGDPIPLHFHLSKLPVQNQAHTAHVSAHTYTGLDKFNPNFSCHNFNPLYLSLDFINK